MSEAPPNVSPWPRRIGAWLIVTGALVRALAAPSTTPWWDLDPLTGWRPETTLTPATSLFLDAAAWFGAFLVLTTARKAGEPIRWKSGALLLLGVIGVVLHAAVLRPLTAGDSSAPRGDFASTLLGSAWAAAMVGAWALLHIGADRALRQAATMTIFAIVAMLSARGAYQAFVEHPRVVAAFKADPAAMLASKGWESDSASARLFERRLNQVEATGWFGLANVYGSLAGACAVAWITLAVGAIRARIKGAIAGGDAGLIVILALAACAALALSGSKGAVVAALVGLFCMAAPLLFPLPHRLLRALAPWIGPAIVGAVLALVLVRGAVGERSAELSLLFRAQYIDGASRIIAEHPLLGVGPAGFKDAYLLAKSPLSPEEIESPHSILFDFVARLGIFGAAWFALWMSWLWATGKLLARSAIPPAHPVDRWPRNGLRAWVAFSLFGAIAASISIERAVIGMDFLLLQVLSAAVACIAIAVALRIAAAQPAAPYRQWIDRALCAAAFALAAHSLIEVTPVTPGASAWFFALFALAAAPESDSTSNDRVGAHGIVGLSCCLALLVGAGAVGFRATRVWRWERALFQAAEALRPVGEFHDALADAQARPREAAARIAVLAAGAGARAPQTEADFESLLRRLQMQSIPKSLTGLDRAASLEPTAWDPRYAAARLELTLAYDLLQSGDPEGAARRADGALARVAAIADIRPRSATAWGRLGAMRVARADLPSPKEVRDAELSAAAEAWEVAAGLDPHSLAPPLALWRLGRETARPEAAERWGRRALEVDSLLRLDPLKGLTEAERAEISQSLPPTPGPSAPPSDDS